MLNLRCLLGQSAGNVKRQLDIYESGVQERGLDWLFKAMRSNEIIQGVSMAREGGHGLSSRALHMSRLWRHQALRPTIQSTTRHPMTFTFLIGRNKNKTKAKAGKDNFIHILIFQN